MTLLGRHFDNSVAIVVIRDIDYEFGSLLTHKRMDSVANKNLKKGFAHHGVTGAAEAVSV